MAQKVEVIMTAKDAEMVRAWQRTKMSVNEFEQSLHKVGRAQDRNRKKSKSMFSTMTSSMTAVVGGMSSVSAGLAIWKAAYAEIIQQVEEIARKHDDVFRKFNVQTGLRGLQGEKAKESILDVAYEQAVSSGQAGQAATQLVSSGFSAEEAQGNSLREFLKILNASNVVGQETDVTGLAKSLVSYMNSQGMELTAKNLAAVGQKVQSNFRSTNIQIADLTELSKVGKTFDGVLSTDEQIASFSQLTQSFPAAEAATGMRNVIGRLQTASSSKEKIKSLKKLGLAPEDVDFVGENFQQVMDSLADGLESVDEKDRKPLLKKIFGEKAVAVAGTLIGDRDRIQEIIISQNDTTQFESDVKESTIGRNAAERRLEINKERQLVKNDDHGDLIREQASQNFRDQGINEVSIFLKNKAFDIARGFGVSSESAAGFAYGNIEDFGAGSTAVKEVEKLLKFDPDQNKKLTESLDKNTKAIEKQTEQQKKNQKVEVDLKVTAKGVNADVTPPKPRPFEGGQ